MKKNVFLLAILIILLVVIGCGQQSAETIKTCNPPYFEYQTGQCCLDQNSNSICDTDEQQETAVVAVPNAEAEEFAEKIVYYMSNAECDKLYTYLYTEYKENTTEGNFTGVCNYLLYGLSFKLDKVTKIEENLYSAYINIVSKDYFETMEIVKIEQGFEYKFFGEYLGFADLREFCNARRKLSEGYDYCVQQWGKANQDESSCDFMGADYKVASCKSVVKASMGE